ncbi:MAG: hypothetical protein ACI4KF_10930 [Huintestinicola sp.]
MKRQIITAAILSALMLSACSNSSEPDAAETAFSETMTEAASETASESETTTAEAETTTVESTEETTAETTVETTELTSITEEVSETIVEPISNSSFRMYELEVKDGMPEICDADAIKARRRTDMAEHYTTWQEEYYSDVWNFGEFADPADFIETYFGYSFDNSAPVTSYVEDDFDLDGNPEYYLCMAEYVVKPDADEPNTYDGGIVTSVYYIDDDGTVMNTFSKLVQLCIPERLYGDSAEDALNSSLRGYSDENNLKFQIERCYGNYLSPLVIDNGDSKHLFWKNDNSYPSDWGAYIFRGDKSIRVEISSPSASLGGFYEWSGKPEEVFFAERKKFGDDFWATQINLATKLDLYTYPEINGKVNTLVWDGQNYVYNIIEPNDYSSYVSGPVEWK